MESVLVIRAIKQTQMPARKMEQINPQEQRRRGDGDAKPGSEARQLRWMEEKLGDGVIEQANRAQ